MKNHKHLFLILLMSSILFLPPASLSAESDLYSFPSVNDETAVTPKEMKPADLFAQILAKKLNVSDMTIITKINKGFGRTEIIRLVLMSQKSNRPLEDVFAERENGTRFSKIAELLKLDNRKIRLEAEEILKQTLEEERKTLSESSEVKKSTAGIEEAAKKKEGEKAGK